MEFINPPGRTVNDSGSHARTCVCSVAPHATPQITLRNMGGGPSCAVCNCACAHGVANFEANRNWARATDFVI